MPERLPRVALQVVAACVPEKAWSSARLARAILRPEPNEVESFGRTRVRPGPVKTPVYNFRSLLWRAVDNHGRRDGEARKLRQRPLEPSIGSTSIPRPYCRP